MEESIEQHNRTLHERYGACRASFQFECCIRVDLFSASSSEVSVTILTNLLILWCHTGLWTYCFNDKDPGPDDKMSYVQVCTHLDADRWDPVRH